MTKRTEAALETRRKLVDAARKLVRERGIACVRVDDLGKACGVAKGTFYVYFKRKEDVVFELSERDLGDLLDESKRFPGGVRLRVERFLTGLSSYIDGNGLKLSQEWLRNTADPDFSQNDAGQKRHKQNLSALVDLLRDSVVRRELRENTPVEELAQTLLEVLYGEVYCWCASNGAFRLSERTRQFCAFFLETALLPYYSDKEKQDESKR